MVFGGIGCDPVTNDVEYGLYTNLGGSLRKVIDNTDTLYGNRIGAIFTGVEALSGNSIAFFGGQSIRSGYRGIFRAVLVSVPEPGSVLGLLAFSSLGALASYRNNRKN